MSAGFQRIPDVYVHTNSGFTLAANTRNTKKKVDGSAESEMKHTSENDQRSVKTESHSSIRAHICSQSLVPDLMTTQPPRDLCQRAQKRFPRILRGSHTSCIIISSHFSSSLPSVSHNSSLSQIIIHQSLLDSAGLTHW